ncbi:phospholipase D-like domain-containing protein [Desulfurococcus amylolyticus]|uniref:Phospholipase D/Transphosphatidylase n=1 Tax=Desulfurococcus amylolyticus DSM 16532 TaxID=768672 RepID=I3XQ77_DESAM|nr:phospholipase D-like domain-containing protein [Desulfurococcus amylolyticus]AFL66101.1 phospholipase D/Transphosphatidylase [Desulfurococcus amylolyticus DSM 16532]
MRAVASLLIVFVLGMILGAFIGVYVYSRYFQTGEGGLMVNNTCSLNLLLDREYYDAVLGTLGSANRSVYIVMYVVKYDPGERGDPVNILLETLTELKNRGVDVKIVVDDTTYKSYNETIYYLLSLDIPVRLDESSAVTTHTKMVIIDNSTVILGSHNWTESALMNNHEASIETNCTSIVSKALSYFDNIWAGSRSI